MSFILKLAIQALLSWGLRWVEAQLAQHAAIERVQVGDPKKLPVHPAPQTVIVSKPRPRKPAPVSTAPGTWNRIEGRWN